MKKIFVAGLILFLTGTFVFAEKSVFMGSSGSGFKKFGSSENGLSTGQFGAAVLGVFSIPSGDIANVFNAALGPEVILTYRNFLFSGLHLQLSGVYFSYTNKVDTSITFTNITAKLSARYDLVFADLPGVVYLKAGGGADFETLIMDPLTLDNIDPVYSFGAGYETKLADNFTLQFEFIYTLMPEKYIAGSTRDGSFISFAGGINCEFGGAERSVTKKSGGR